MEEFTLVDFEENKRDLQELKNRFLKLEETIGDSETLEKKLKELEEKTLADGFWNDSKTSNSVLKEIKELKNKYNGIEQNIKSEPHGRFINLACKALVFISGPNLHIIGSAAPYASGSVAGI